MIAHIKAKETIIELCNNRESLEKSNIAINKVGSYTISSMISNFIHQLCLHHSLHHK